MILETDLITKWSKHKLHIMAIMFKINTGRIAKFEIYGKLEYSATEIKVNLG